MHSSRFIVCSSLAGTSDECGTNVSRSVYSVTALLAAKLRFKNDWAPEFKHNNFSIFIPPVSSSRNSTVFPPRICCFLCKSPTEPVMLSSPPIAAAAALAFSIFACGHTLRCVSSHTSCWRRALYSLAVNASTPFHRAANGVVVGLSTESLTADCILGSAVSGRPPHLAGQRSSPKHQWSKACWSQHPLSISVMNCSSSGFRSWAARVIFNMCFEVRCHSANSTGKLLTA